MARFANPALMHRTRQIAMDGSQKLPQRLLAPIARRLDRGQGIDALALAVAAWMRWQDGHDDAGLALAVQDPLAAITAEAVRRGGTPLERVTNLLRIGTIFPARLAQDEALRAPLVAHLARLEDLGADAAIADSREASRVSEGR
jgi:fructuronate reductase